MQTRQHNERGVALVTVLMLLALLMTMLAGYFTLSQIEYSTTQSTMNSFKGLYAAEGGLNLRAELLREAFLGYTQPTGTSPSTDSTTAACAGTNLGTSDFACITYSLQNRDVTTYVFEGENNPMPITTPRGETYQNLNAREDQYVVFSQAENAAFTEAILEMHFRSRLVPVFQFAAFFNKDLEIISADNLLMDGPVHANGDIFLAAVTGSMDIYQQITASGDIFRGPKSSDICVAGPVKVADPDTQIALPVCSGGRREYTPTELAPWNDMIQNDLDELVVPVPEDLYPSTGHIYWDNADIRIMLDLNGGTPAIEVRDAGGNKQIASSTSLATCGPVSHTTDFYNHREGGTIDMLDVDLQDLLDCLHVNSLLDAGKGLDDTTDGGLVLYLGVDGPNMAGQNLYGVRVSDGSELVSTVGGAPAIAGLTIVTNQAMYVEGNYNKDNKKPAAFISDSLNILSANWDDSNGDSTDPLSDRDAGETTIQAAFLTGTDTTGGDEGVSGRDLGQFGGGFLGLARLHENWVGDKLNYFGSFISLNNPQHVDGVFVIGGMHFMPPTWNWNFEPDFVDVVLLPPLSPRFIYLRQELFIRQYEI